MTLLNDVAVTLNLKKCWFFTDHMDYLRHLIKYGRPQLSSQKIEAICSLKAPSNIT